MEVEAQQVDAGVAEAPTRETALKVPEFIRSPAEKELVRGPAEGAPEGKSSESSLPEGGGSSSSEESAPSGDVAPRPGAGAKPKSSDAIHPEHFKRVRKRAAADRKALEELRIEHEVLKRQMAARVEAPVQESQGDPETSSWLDEVLGEDTPQYPPEIMERLERIEAAQTARGEREVRQSVDKSKATLTSTLARIEEKWKDHDYLLGAKDLRDHLLQRVVQTKSHADMEEYADAVMESRLAMEKQILARSGQVQPGSPAPRPRSSSSASGSLPSAKAVADMTEEEIRILTFGQ